MDRLSREHRSWNMSQIRGRDTLPERRVRSALHREGLRFRLHDRALPGSPDIVLRKHHLVVFVHGCFWHRHPRCRCAYSPKTRQAFWKAKFEANVARDRRDAAALRRMGWRVIVVWECQTESARGLLAVVRRIRRITHGEVSSGHRSPLYNRTIG